MSTSQTTEENRLNRQATAVTAGVLIALILTAATALGAGVYRYNIGGAIKSVRTQTTTGDTFYTVSNTYHTVAESAAGLTVPSGEKALLIITFSAESVCKGTGACHVTAYVDGVQASPADVYFDEPTTNGMYQARSFQWVSKVLGPGSHVVTIGGRVDSGTQFLLSARTLTVLSSKV